MAKIALLPGGFKPPHAGHYNMAKWLAANTDADIVLVKVGAKEREGITREMSLKLWNLYTQKDNNIKIKASESPSPVRDVYDFIEQEAPEGSTVYLGMGEKDIEDKRFANIGKFAEPKGIKFKTILVPPQAGGISGTQMRDFVKNDNKESFQKYLPDHINKEEAWDIVSSVNEDLYDPNDKVLDYMRSNDPNPKDDIPPSYKYKRGGIYGRAYENREGRKKLRVYDFDDTLAITRGANIKVKHADGSVDTLDPAQFAVYKGQPGDKFDFTEFDSVIKDAEPIQNIVSMLRKDLTTTAKVTILTARLLAYPVRRYLKTLGLDVYVVAVGSSDPNDKAKWIENHIKKGYDDILFIDDSEKNRNAVISLEDKYPNIKLNVLDPDAVQEMMMGMMSPAEKKKHNRNMKRLSKDLKRINKGGSGSNYGGGGYKVPQYVKGTLTRKLREFTDQELKYWALYAHIAKKLDAPDSEETYLRLKNELTGEELDALNWFYNTYFKPDSLKEGDTYEKMAAKGKKKGTLKQGTVRKRLKIKAGEKIPLSKINKAISRIKKMENPSEKNKKYLKALNLAKTLKTNENYPPYKADQVQKVRYQASDTFTNSPKQAKKRGYLETMNCGCGQNPCIHTGIMHEADPKVGTGKKPKGSGRRLYTDENPKDTVKVKFSTRQDIVDTLSKKSFKSKSHKRKSQIINLIHQRVRAALGRAKDPAVKKRLRSAFNYIKKRKEASKRKTQRMKKENVFTREWWKDIIKEMLITEGGAAGHMAHPFNLPNVNNGRDLLNIFEKSADSLDRNPGAVKIDGVNSSIRLVDLDGKKQFVMDRGSKKELDVKGITKDDLLRRFGDGHGMVKVGGEVLDLFNSALPSIKSNLVALGVYNDPNILFNMEYVSGKTNVQEYGSNFIAIHGLNKIESKEVQGKRGPLTKRVSSEISYDKNALKSLLNNLEPIAKKRGYEIYGSVPTKMTKKPNFSAALSKTYTVNAGEKSETKSLKQWLDMVNDIPEEDFIFMNVDYEKDSSTVNRKKVGAVSKQVYLAILNGENIDGLFEDSEERKKAVQGFVTYLATEKLGDEVIKVLSSPMGSVENHEGVVIRDKNIANVPFKITGKFILGGLATSFR